MLRTEDEARDDLERLLARCFWTYREVNLRHALFRRRTLRADLIAIPKDQNMEDIAIAFECKRDQDWSDGPLGPALKQAADYVLATIEDPIVMPRFKGVPVMGSFLYEAPACNCNEGPSVKAIACSGMMHMAGLLRVGGARPGRKGRLTLSFGATVVWDERGWWANARNVLVGKRQIGSQRFPILDELRAQAQALKPNPSGPAAGPP